MSNSSSTFCWVYDVPDTAVPTPWIRTPVPAERRAFRGAGRERVALFNGTSTPTCGACSAACLHWSSGSPFSGRAAPDLRVHEAGQAGDPFFDLALREVADGQPDAPVATAERVEVRHRRPDDGEPFGGPREGGVVAVERDLHADEEPTRRPVPPHRGPAGEVPV